PLPVGEVTRTGAGQRRRLVLIDGSVLYLNQQTTVKLVAERLLKLERGEVLVETMPGKTPLRIDAASRKVAALDSTVAVRMIENGADVIVARGRVKVRESEQERDLSVGQRLAPGSDRPETAPRLSAMLDWARDLMVAAGPSLVPASSHGGGSLTVVDPEGQEAKLSLRKYHIDV